MAEFFSTDYFTSQAEMMRSAASDEEINLQLDIAVPKLQHDLHLLFAVPKLNKAPTPLFSQHACASSSTRNGEARSSAVGPSPTRNDEARSSGSFGPGITEVEENFLRSFLGINLKPAVQERECGFCTRIRPLTEFISTKDCAHLYCTDCCERHAEREILTNTSQIECPYPNCRHNFDVVQCSTLLSKASFDILNTKQTEAAIPASERVYCPFPNCSVFIPVVKSASSNSAEDTFVECRSCHRGFCLECNIPWERMCGICAEMRPHKDFMSTSDCAHEYCTDCCKRHAERKILSRSSQIDCPHASCSHNFDIEQCSTLLSQIDLDILNMRQTEAAIPASQRVYCPFPDCSVFIPLVKSESRNSVTDTFVECHSCHRGFCLECNIPWERICGICGEKRKHKEFTSTKDCAHEYCTDCSKWHAERKILSGSLQIECLHPNCRHNFKIEQCSILLSQTNLDILNMRLTEAAIPTSERVYCPFPNCSVFIPVLKSGSSNSATDMSRVECYSCHQNFCLECNIPWHANKTCGEYRADVERIENLKLQEKFLKSQALAEANGFDRFGEEQASRSGGMCRVSLEPSSSFKGYTSEEFHFRTAESQFFRMSQNRKMKVTKVEFIRNVHLEERFNQKKEEFKRSNVAVEARFVFHGTDLNAINKITTEGFKIGGEGVALKCGAAYGRGVYTAVNPDISVAYCRGSKMMLLSIAIPGELGKHYNHGASADVFVIRDVSQLLPTYVVHYS